MLTSNFKKTPLSLLAVSVAALAVGLFGGSRCGHAAAPQGDDVIEVREGGATKLIKNVHVDSAEYGEVAYTIRGSKRKLAGSQVVAIRWGDAPDDYAVGLRALRAGEGEKARKAFQSCLDQKLASDLRNWVEEYSHLGKADAHSLLALGDAKEYDNAIKHYNAAKSANSRSRVLDKILQGLAAAEAAKGNSSGALRAAGDLVTAGRTGRRTRWEIAGHELTARLHLGEGKHAEAGRSFDAVTRLVEQAMAGESDPAAKRKLERVLLKASASKGWVLVDKAEKSKSSADIDTARNYFNQLAAKFGRRAQAQAAQSNARGVLKLLAGDAEAARRDLVHTEVNYFTVADEVARSLYYQAQCLDKLGRKSEREARIRDLKEYYPRSEWARRL